MRYILKRISFEFRKISMRLKESEIIGKLTGQEATLRPLIVDEVCREETSIRNYQIDAVIKFSIEEGPSFTAAIELSILSTPKALAQKCKALATLSAELKNRNMIPMIVTPYVNETQSKLLFDEGISWIDLSGNMRVKIAPNIYIERTGKPNKFPDTSPIKKIYEGTSALVGRALLLNPEGYSSVYKIADFINDRNAAITNATVSKVLRSLEEELVVSRAESKIRLKKPETLLDNLAQGYSEYARRRKDRKYKYDVEDINKLTTILYESQIDYAYCGFYAAKLKGLAITDQIAIFIKSIQDVNNICKQNASIAAPDEEYGQVTFIETNNPCVWFNIQNEPFDAVVDDLELYLEMVNDLPRGPKIALQLKEEILGKFNG